MEKGKPGVQSQLLPTSGKQLKSQALKEAGLSTSTAHRCEEIASEAEALEKILRPKAKERERAGKKIDPDQNSEQGRTLLKTAKSMYQILWPFPTISAHYEYTAKHTANNKKIFAFQRKSLKNMVELIGIEPTTS